MSQAARKQDDVPEGNVADSSYKTQGKNESVPVQGDDEDLGGINPETADSDQQLEQDEKEAVDKSNILNERTRHAKPSGGSYQEPGDVPKEALE